MKWQNAWFGIGLAVALSLCGSAAASAQQTAPGPPVRMVVTVMSRHGGEIPAIKGEDVVVTEGHDRDNVVGWVPAIGADAGLDLYIVLDDSSTWTVDAQLADLRGFITQQPPSTYIAVGYMSNGTVRTVQSLTAEHAAAADAVRLTMGRSSGRASPYFSVEDLIKHWLLDPARPRREIVMITNGADPYSPSIIDPYLDETIDGVQRAGILVYSIYAPTTWYPGRVFSGVNRGQNNLSRISDESGAESYDLGVVVAASFKPYFDDISRRLAHQYLLTFLPKPQKYAGMQSVKLRTEVPNAELVGPRRVYVPALSDR